MPRKNNRHSSAKKLHVRLLRTVLCLCILLIFGTIALQVVNLVNPALDTAKTPYKLGETTKAFVFTTENIFPFLLIPMLLLVITALYLQKFFSRNSFDTNDRIPYFDRYPHTRFGRKFCMFFALLLSAISFAICLLTHIMHGLSGLWFGFILVACTSYLYYVCAKMLRHRRREYIAHQRKHGEKKTA